MTLTVEGFKILDASGTNEAECVLLDGKQYSIGPDIPCTAERVAKLAIDQLVIARQITDSGKLATTRLSPIRESCPVRPPEPAIFDDPEALEEYAKRLKAHTAELAAWHAQGKPEATVVPVPPHLGHISLVGGSFFHITGPKITLNGVIQDALTPAERYTTHILPYDGVSDSARFRLQELVRQNCTIA